MDEYKQNIIAQIKELQKIHLDSTSPMDAYFTGFYNGMEAILSVISGEEPVYKNVERKG